MLSDIANLEIIENHDGSTIALDKKISLSLLNLNAIHFASKFGLKTLDNYHLATVDLYNKMNRDRTIEYFITADNEIVQNKTNEYTNFEIIHPKDFVKLNIG